MNRSADKPVISAVRRNRGVAAIREWARDRTVMAGAGDGAGSP